MVSNSTESYQTMITLTTVNLPFIVNKEKEHSPEGSFSLYFYSRKIIHKNKVRYKFEPLRFDGEVARFKSRKDAKRYAQYRLGID
jgi:hypothetical protein